MEISTVLYYQLNIDTIVEKYCVNKERPRLNCNGKCYLMTQMKTANKPSSSEKSETIIITEAFIPLFFQENTFQLKNIITNYNITHNWKSHHLQVLEISNTIDHPPQYM
ncbi:hypothetical protein [Aquimarina sp. 2304DJ70-9]|uniref:hypothetical protein n=1 Tax=Aquimarina penaris TaxID=3231044 RepID=UPI003461A9EE